MHVVLVDEGRGSRSFGGRFGRGAGGNVFRATRNGRRVIPRTNKICLRLTPHWYRCGVDP